MQTRGQVEMIVFGNQQHATDAVNGHYVKLSQNIFFIYTCLPIPFLENANKEVQTEGKCFSLNTTALYNQMSVLTTLWVIIGLH